MRLPIFYTLSCIMKKLILYSLCIFIFQAGVWASPAKKKNKLRNKAKAHTEALMKKRHKKKSKAAFCPSFRKRVLKQLW